MEYLNHIYEKIFRGGNADTPQKIVCFGNVLLDRIVQLNDPELLKRHGLTMGSKGEMELAQLSQIAADASACNDAKCITSPGGSALNTVRILKQLGTEAQFFGAVGADKPAEELRDILKERGIEARLQTIDGESTGQCLCLMFGDKPTMYANIGASAKFVLSDLLKVEESFLRPIERKQILYIEGFIVPHLMEVCDHIVTQYIKDRRRLAVNLSASYIVKEHSESMLKLVRHAYFVFGNQQEFEALCAVANCSSTEELARQLTQENGQVKILVITQGAIGVQLITNFEAELSPPGELKFENYKAQQADQIVDATGAGDAFAAAFLHAWLQKRSLCECVRTATAVAAKVVTQVGCNLP